MQSDPAIALQANAHRRWIRQRGIPAAIPHSRNSHSATQWPFCCRVELRPRGTGRFPFRPQRFEARMDTNAFTEYLSGNGRRVVVQSVQNAKLEAIYADAIGQFVVDLFLRNCGLRHAESAKRARGNDVRVHGSSQRPIVGHYIRSGSVHRDTSRDSRSPRRICTGIEIGTEVERSESSVAHGTRTQPHPCRVPLGRRHNRLRSGIDHADWPTQLPCCQGDEWLNGKIEFRSESSAHRRRDNPNLLLRNAQNLGDIVPVHIRRLRTRLNFNRVADSSRKSRLGFNVGVLNKSSLELSFDHEVRLLQSLLHISANNSSPYEDILIALFMNTRRTIRESLIDRLNGRQLFPSHRNLGEIQFLQSIRLADDGGDGLSTISSLPMRKYGLIGTARNDSVAINPGHVFRCQHQYNTRMPRHKPVQIAKLKTRPMMRRPHGADSQSISRNFIRPKDLAAFYLALSIEAHEPSTNCRTRLGSLHST